MNPQPSFLQSDLPSYLSLWDAWQMGKFLVSLKELESWFQSQKRVLPWRDVPSVYRVWVSEVMLQQTQVVTVVPYFERFIERFPSVEHLAKAELDEVLLYWSGLGYYSRARNLYKGAKKIQLNGRFPQNRTEWLDVPGVGQYTAGAILSIAFNQPEAILDGNLERVLSRVRRVSREQGDQNFKSRLWEISKIFVESAHRHQIQPSLLNQALMELGAMVCTPKKPRCQECPLQLVCRGYQKGDQILYPPKKKPTQWIKLDEKLHCFVHGSDYGTSKGSGHDASHEKFEILMESRPSGKWRAGLWDLLESKPSTMFSSIIKVGEIETKYCVTRHKVRRLTEVWKVVPTQKALSWTAAETPDLDGATLKWVPLDRLDIAMGAPVKKTLKAVQGLL